MTCHSQLFTDQAMLAPVRASLAEGRPLVWNRVHKLPDFAYFDHAVHVRKGVSCDACHGDVAAQPLMAKAKPLDMGFCLDCHRHPEKAVPPGTKVASPQLLTSCSTCHR